MAIAALSILVSASVVSGQSSVEVVLLISDGPFRPDGLVPFRFLVFDHGIPVDADALWVTFTLYECCGSRFLPWNRTGTGAYAADFVLSFGGYAPGPAFSVSVAVRVGAKQAYTEVTRAIQVLEVEVLLSARSAVPGDTLTAEIRVRNGAGDLAETSGIDVFASVFTRNTLEFAELTVRRLTTGRYSTSYTIDGALTRDALVIITATVGDLTSGTIAIGSAQATVDVPEWFEVWYRPVSIRYDEAEFAIWVADDRGYSLADADVSFEFSSFDSGTSTVWTGQDSAKTNASGAASFRIRTLSYPISIDGVVTMGGEAQNFSGQISSLTNFLPAQPGFWVLSRDLLPPTGPLETPVRYNYTAYLGTAPVDSASVHYYARTANEMIAWGNVATDAAGNFSLTLPVKGEGLRIGLRSEIAGAWHETETRIAAFLPLQVTLDDLFVGSTTKLMVHPPPGGWNLGLVVFTPLDSPAPPWLAPSAWERWTGFFGAGDMLAPTNGTVSATVVVPRFLPKGNEYLLAVAAFPDLDAPDGPSYIWWQRVTIENLLPVIDASDRPSVLLEGQTMAFNLNRSVDRDGSIIAYSVDWGDGTETDWAASPEFDHTYVRAGVYTITVQARDDSGDVAQIAFTTEVRSLIVASLSERAPVLVALLIAGLVATAWVGHRRKRTADAPARDPPSEPPQGPRSP